LNAFFCICLSSVLAFSADGKKALSLKELFKTADDTVVFITAGGKLQGSGVSVKKANVLTPSTNGTLIVTNAHVVGDFKKVSIITNKKTEFVGAVVAVDSVSDLALVQIEGITLHTVTLEQNNNQLNIGDRVFAIGSPKGMSNSLSEGIISGIRQRGPTSVIQTTAAISKGSSGGGLFDRRGKLVGITTFKIIDGENVNFAVHVKHVNDLINKPIEMLSVSNPDMAKSHINKGKIYANDKKYQQAIAEFDQAIRLEPNNSEAYEQRGSAFGELKQSERAIADYDQALRINPNDEFAYYGRALEYYHLRKYESAIADYDQFILLKPDLGLAYYSRGIVYNDIKDYDRAIADYTQAIRLTPNHALSYNNRGNAYSALTLYERAIEDFNQAISIDPNDALAYNNRAVAYANIKNYQSACFDAAKSCDLGICKFYGYLREKGRCK
jgi:tetratricopeptide (TPR) repeat protein